MIGKVSLPIVKPYQSSNLYVFKYTSLNFSKAIKLELAVKVIYAQFVTLWLHFNYYNIVHKYPWLLTLIAFDKFRDVYLNTYKFDDW